MSDLTTRLASLADPALGLDHINAMHLLQASAGTGKTYSIQTIYLRLILIEGLTVQQLLTVTFTKDATKELRDRLQGVLREALDYLDGRGPIPQSEHRTKLIVDVARRQQGGEALARERLWLALLDFDMAAIYTIHGFCQRILKRFAFETCQPFDREPAGESDAEIEQLCRDWWRRNVYPMDTDIAAFLVEACAFSLGTITKLAKKLIAKPDAITDAIMDIEGDAAAPPGSIESMIHRKLEASRDHVFASSPLDNMPDTIQSAAANIRQHASRYKESVNSKEWTGAITLLCETAAMVVETDNPCSSEAETLQKACADLAAEINKASKKDYAFCEDGSLHHSKRPNLRPAHTTVVKRAVTAFVETLARQEAMLPDSLFTQQKRTKGFLHARAVYNHFNQVDELSANEFAEAVKIIAKNSLGLSGKIKIKAEMVFPGICRLVQSLKSEPELQAALAIREQYQAGRAAARSASFNDYLVDLRQALRDDDSLVEVLRNEFRAALIDEFQDTDPIQWGIFEKLFVDAGMPLFLVGDPKQAIYRFRDGDVETYINATAAIENAYPLDTNHRSEKRLIDAVNQVFLDAAASPTFGDQISYDCPLAAAGKAADACLLTGGEPDDQPFKVVLIPNIDDPTKLPGLHSKSARLAYALTAAEIARILADDRQTIGGRRVRARDIAVLVGKHDEAAYIERELASRHVRAVRQGTGNVWQTDEGRHLWTLLEAVLDARNPSRVRNALYSPWCGLSIEQILDLNANRPVTVDLKGKQQTCGLDDWVALFDDLRETWGKRGYPAMFRQFAAYRDLKARLLEHPDRQGQRRLANISHLSELVEQAIIEGRRTPDGVLDWIRRQLDPNTGDGGDALKLRLESDDDAVRIMTVFTSKGLEFPIVFAPTLFMLKPGKPQDYIDYHDADGRLHIARKIKDDPVSAEAREKELAEVNREHTRQIYVALTRAVHRTVVFAVASNRGNSALERLLRLQVNQIEHEEGQPEIEIDQEGTRARFENVEGVGCAVAVIPFDALGPDADAVTGESVALVEPLPRQPPDTGKGHSSFSSLAPREGEADDRPSAAGEAVKDRDGETMDPAADAVTTPAAGIFAFPAGARTGDCWHEIFEVLAFDADEATIESVVVDRLGLYGFLRDETLRDTRIADTVRMVRNILRTPLPPCGNATPFSLSAVASGDRKSEWGFSFAARDGKRTPHVREAIANDARYSAFTDALGAWDKAIPGGFLTGFVDLLFRHDGRYYIADWKSNRRNGTQADFRPDGLVSEISRHRYWLQYLIYTVAVHQYLSATLPGYRYADQFGGVYYVFLRGVDGEVRDGHTNGIYYDRPPVELIEDLSSILGAFA